ncbi:MAG: ribbon-helix-helix domain-containing protein [Candidatus Ranarchaeia archaeon]|jgi:Arc/MetJ-type ribon-helix-helix transcriptional regulator
MKLITFHLPEQCFSGLDELVKLRLYPNKSEAIRAAVRDLLNRELDQPLITYLKASTKEISVTDLKVSLVDSED